MGRSSKVANSVHGTKHETTIVGPHHRMRGGSACESRQGLAGPAANSIQPDGSGNRPVQTGAAIEGNRPDRIPGRSDQAELPEIGIGGGNSSRRSVEPTGGGY